MLKNTPSRCAAVTLMLAALLLFNACREDTLLGREIIPGSDFLNGTFTDTLTLEAITVREDTLQTKNLSRYVLGAMDDEVFGNSYAAIFSQLSLVTPGINFHDTAFVDSAVLSLTLTGFYGDTTSTVHNIRVFRLTEAMPDTAAIPIYSSTSYTYEPLAIGQAQNVKPNYTKPYVEGNTTYRPQIRIPIDNAFAQEMLNQVDAYANQAALNEWFKGLHIAPDTTQGFKDGVMLIDLRGASAESALTIYYHTDNTTGNRLSFPLRGAATNANYFRHNYTGTPVAAALNNPAQGDVAFVQAMAGVKVAIRVPHLQNLGNVVLNKAEVQATVLSPFNDPETQYNTPGNILVVANNNGANQAIPDQIFSAGLPTYGGNRLTETADGVTYTRYRVSVVSQLQKMLMGTATNDGFFLINFQSSQRADRLIIGGPDRTDPYRLKLNIVYTRIPSP